KSNASSVSPTSSPSFWTWWTKRKLLQSRCGAVLPDSLRTAGFFGGHARYPERPVSFPGSAHQEAEPGRQVHLRCHLRHHGRGKEGRNGPRDHQKRCAAEIFSKVLHAQTDAGHHHQAAGTVAENAPAQPGTL